MSYAATMTDESSDVIPDDHFYVSCGVDGVWRLYDTGVITVEKATLAEIRAFVHGLWAGMAIVGAVDMTCAIYNSKGRLLDNMIASETLRL